MQGSEVVEGGSGVIIVSSVASVGLVVVCKVVCLDVVVRRVTGVNVDKYQDGLVVMGGCNVVLGFVVEVRRVAGVLVVVVNSQKGVRVD